MFLHVGQCGNQLGQAFWEEVISPRWSTSESGGAHHHIIKSTALPSPLPSARRTPHTSRPSPSLRPAAPASAAASRSRAPPASGYVPFTLVDGTIPCVMVDAEPKVIRQCLDRRRGSPVLRQRVRDEFCVWDRAGRGNNWAYGYYGRRRGREGEGGSGGGLLGRVREAVRKVVERCDRFSGFLMLHGIAGGTGSGKAT